MPLGSRGSPGPRARMRCNAATCTRLVLSPPARVPCPQGADRAFPTRLPDLPVQAGFLGDVPAGLFYGALGRAGHGLILRSSTRITSNRRARSVPVFSTQSLRRSVSRAFTLAIASLDLAAPVRPAPGLGELALKRTKPARSRPDKPGTTSISPVDRAALTVTPRSTPTASPVPGAGTRFGDRGERDMPSARRGPGLSGTTSPRSGPARDQRNRTQPAFGTSTCPIFLLRRRTSAVLRTAHDAETLVAARLSARPARRRAVEEIRHGGGRGP